MQIWYGWPQPLDLGCCSHHRMGATLKHLKVKLQLQTKATISLSDCQHTNTHQPPNQQTYKVGLWRLQKTKKPKLKESKTWSFWYNFNTYNEPTRSLSGIRRIEWKLRKSMKNTANIRGPDIQLAVRIAINRLQFWISYWLKLISFIWWFPWMKMVNCKVGNVKKTELK